MPVSFLRTLSQQSINIFLDIFCNTAVKTIQTHRYIKQDQKLV